MTNSRFDVSFRFKCTKREKVYVGIRPTEHGSFCSDLKHEDHAIRAFANSCIRKFMHSKIHAFTNSQAGVFAKKFPLLFENAQLFCLHIFNYLLR